MSLANSLPPFLKKLAEALNRHVWLWFLPTIGMTLAAAVYVQFREPSWRATQALVVRDEAGGGSHSRPGRFDSTETMKTAQETILEVARNKSVVEAALRSLGPPPDDNRDPWPTPDDVEQLQKRITVRAPKGAEFGRTEVIYLSVTGPSQAAAVARTTTVCEQLIVHLAQLRRSRAASIIDELERNVLLTQADLEEATESLQAMESQVGPDLGELRILNDSGAGEGNLRLALNQVKAELREAQADRQANQELLDLLREAQNDPDQFLATPSRLLDSQPALSKLKEGLVDAQLRTADLLGRMNEVHPLAQAAVRSEQEVRQDLYAELDSARRGVETDLQVGGGQIAALTEQREELQNRLDRLAGLRAHYSNRVDDVRQRTEIHQRAKRVLADARASQSAAQESSLLTRFHEPQVGDAPVGPSKATVVAAGFGGGLAAGLGLVLLTLPMGPSHGRRWSDYIGFGRRATDRSAERRGSRRSTDASQPPENIAESKRDISARDRRSGTRQGDDDRPTEPPAS